MAKLIFLAYVFITSLGLITLKLSTTSGLPLSFAEGHIIFDINIYTIVGIFLYGLSFLIYIYLISKFSLGYVIPITTAVVYILVFTASFVIFKEAFTLTKIIGIGFILTGLIFLNFKKSPTD